MVLSESHSLCRLEKWAGMKHVKFNKGKYKGSPPSGMEKLQQLYKWGWLARKQLCRKDLGFLVELPRVEHCAFTAKKCNRILWKECSQQVQGSDRSPLFRNFETASGIGPPVLGSSGQERHWHTIGSPVEGQLDPELGQKRHEQRLRELGLFSLNKAQGRSYGCLKPAVHEAGVRLFAAVWTGGRANNTSWNTGNSNGLQGNKFLWWGWLNTETGHPDGGISILRDIQDWRGHGPELCALLGRAWKWRLD